MNQTNAELSPRNIPKISNAISDISITNHIVNDVSEVESQSVKKKKKKTKTKKKNSYKKMLRSMKKSSKTKEEQISCYKERLQRSLGGGGFDKISYI